MNYIEKLKDPRWQRKRLEVMERDNFTCVMCRSTEKTLAVHHGYYKKGANPWEYDADVLHTVCMDCHEQAEFLKMQLYKSIAKKNPREYYNLINDIDLGKNWTMELLYETLIEIGDPVEALKHWLEGMRKQA